jgi:large subunit ribosomal protein L5
MNFINDIIYKNNIKYALLNKFNYKNLSEIPTLEKVNLSLNIKNRPDLNFLVSSLVALELLTNQKGFLIRSKTFNLTTKIRKGDPIGARVTLRKEKARQFLLRLSNTKFGFPKNNNNTKHFSFLISNLMFFKEFEVNYHFFRRLGSLNVVVNTTALTREEFIFLLRFYKI